MIDKFKSYILRQYLNFENELIERMKTKMLTLSEVKSLFKGKEKIPFSERAPLTN